MVVVMCTAVGGYCTCHIRIPTVREEKKKEIKVANVVSSLISGHFSHKKLYHISLESSN